MRGGRDVLKVGSLFDGLGGFPLSAYHVGMLPVWASEIEPFPINVTAERFPAMEHLGDIVQINGAEIEPVDIITFGSPCQDMSVAGKREGLVGGRSALFYEATRIIAEMRAATDGAYPRYAIWENVPGAFSSQRGRDFRAVLEELTDTEIPIPQSGHWEKDKYTGKREWVIGWAPAGMVRGNGREVAWRQLDAQYFGVPQRRKRIFLVCDFRGERAAEILFEREGLPGHFEPGGETGQEAARDIGERVDTASYGFRWAAGTAETMRACEEIAPTVRANRNGEPAVLYDISDRRRVAGESKGVCPTLTRKMGTGGNTVPVYCYPEPASPVLAKGNLPHRDDTDNLAVSGYTVRRLTPLEVNRLFGFPDYWAHIKGASDTAIYKAFGNSVAVGCVEWIMGRI